VKPEPWVPTLLLAELVHFRLREKGLS
jgi:hypothetical protein